MGAINEDELRQLVRNREQMRTGGALEEARKALDEAFDALPEEGSQAHNLAWARVFDTLIAVDRLLAALQGQTPGALEEAAKQAVQAAFNEGSTMVRNRHADATNEEVDKATRLALDAFDNLLAALRGSTEGESGEGQAQASAEVGQSRPFPSSGPSPSEGLYRMIGAEIRRLREAKGWTQDELSRRAKVDESKATISHYENDRRIPKVKALVKIMRALGGSIDRLYGLDNPPERRRGVKDRRGSTSEPQAHESHRWVPTFSQHIGERAICGDCGTDVRDDVALAPCTRAGSTSEDRERAWAEKLAREGRNPTDCIECGVGDGSHAIWCTHAARSATGEDPSERSPTEGGGE